MASRRETRQKSTNFTPGPARALSTPGINAQVTLSRRTPLLPPNSANDHAIFHQRVNYQRPILGDHDRYPPMRSSSFPPSTSHERERFRSEGAARDARPYPRRDRSPKRGERQWAQYRAVDDRCLWPAWSENLYHEPEGLRDWMKRDSTSSAPVKKSPSVSQKVKSFQGKLVDAGRAVKAQFGENSRAVRERMGVHASAVREKAQTAVASLSKPKRMPAALEEPPHVERDFTVFSLHDMQFPGPEIRMDGLDRGNSGEMAVDSSAEGELDPYTTPLATAPRPTVPTTERVYHTPRMRRRLTPTEQRRQRFEERHPLPNIEETTERSASSISSMESLPTPAYPHLLERDEVHIAQNRALVAHQRQTALAQGEQDHWTRRGELMLAARYLHDTAGILTPRTAMMGLEGRRAAEMTPPRERQVTPPAEEEEGEYILSSFPITPSSEDAVPRCMR
ncbi:hypothetical protein PRZ48_006856 [Zasmidium cellare]|uniref:Uncharacterized protein n=1 Tax=Zasmidium cellare TaxID=395010 RepID=A0ABR0EHS7_ZASCE|nr:hypothetical protein PRZ48_006856 [Zasmidium cellare]